MTRARPHSISSGSASVPGAVVEEMTRRVDVSAGVGAHVQRRDVRAVAVRAIRLIASRLNGVLPG